jgi:hypothetical protein
MENGMDMIREISTTNTRMGMGVVVCREKVRHTVARDAPLFQQASRPIFIIFKQGPER